MSQRLLSLGLIPLLMLVVATSYLTLVAVGQADHLAVAYAVVMFSLTALNLRGERRVGRR